MLNSLRGMVFLGVLAAGFAVLTPFTRVAQAQTGWEYVPELGGYLDWDTGLVWGEHSAVLGTGSWSFNGTNKTFLPRYRAATGIAAWRMPTKAEVEAAAAKDAADYILPPPPQHTLFWNCWTSTTKGKNFAYIGNILTGGGGYYSTKSYTNVIPVYRAFTP